MNGGGPTAQIIEREGWKTDKDFVGHRKAITCVVSELCNFLFFLTSFKHCL
jgi:protein HIRA/HIR1